MSSLKISILDAASVETQTLDVHFIERRVTVVEICDEKNNSHQIRSSWRHAV